MESDTPPGQSVEHKTRTLAPYLWLTLAALFWAGNFVIGRAMRGNMPPVVLNFGRWLIVAGIALTSWQLEQENRQGESRK